MIKLNFFVEINSKDYEEIKKMVETFDETKCSYRIHALNQTSINGRNLPILKLTLETGEVREYNKDTMFKMILNAAKIELD